jgi:hypothetical protein
MELWRRGRRCESSRGALDGASGAGVGVAIAQAFRRASQVVTGTLPRIFLTADGRIDLDFGPAKEPVSRLLLNESRRVGGTIRRRPRTIGYMSPEQVAGGPSTRGAHLPSERSHELLTDAGPSGRDARHDDGDSHEGAAGASRSAAPSRPGSRGSSGGAWRRPEERFSPHDLALALSGPGKTGVTASSTWREYLYPGLSFHRGYACLRTRRRSQGPLGEPLGSRVTSFVRAGRWQGGLKGGCHRQHGQDAAQGLPDGAGP